MKDLKFSPHSTSAIGSFRNDTDVQKYLPSDLYNALFGEIPNNLDARSLVTVPNNKTLLNNGAFGHAYDEVRKLSRLLREFSEDESEIFFDQVCLPLVNHSYAVVEEFMETPNVLLVPNCTMGMKCIADSLFKTRGHTQVACLLPLYGATAKLLEYYDSEETFSTFTRISPGENPLLEENPDVIIGALEDAYSMEQFTVLFCDEIASQSGRQLPIEAIADFCESNGVELVVDGTQSCQLFFGNKKQVLHKIDYFVMSTHKWIGNTKTCGIIRFKNHAPLPPAISFGWEADTKKRPSIEKVRAQFTWQGMMDSYVSYITLSKAVNIFTKYGEEQFFQSSALLREGLTTVLDVKSLLPSGKERVMEIFELESTNLLMNKNIEVIQNALQDYGLFVSVKKIGQDCSGITIDGHKILNTHGGSIKKGGSSNGGSNGDSAKTQDNNNNNNNEGASCGLPQSLFYLRVSCWSYNNRNDFKSLRNVFDNNLRLSTTKNAAIRQQFLYMYELYEKLFSTLKTRAFFMRAEKLRHHLVFYYGHTAVFYVNKLIVSGHLSPVHRFDPRLESSLSVGVDEMSWDDILEENYDWSSLNEAGLEKFLARVREYRTWVKQLVLKLIDETTIEHPIAQGSLAWILLMGIEHEKIHLETSAVIISQVPLDLITRHHNFNIPPYWKGRKYITDDNKAANILSPQIKPPNNKLVSVPGGTVLLGKCHMDTDLYGWDNEYGYEKKNLESFEASQMLVSNAEYYQFVQDGAYTPKGRHWWSEEGWRYVTILKVTGPRFWVRNNEYYRAMLEEIPMPWDFPVEVNNLEAEAFCNWKSEQLGRAVRMISHEESVHMRLIAKHESANLNLNKFASPTPVNLYHGTIGGQKIYDISGNVWRHSVSVATVMDGFKIDPSYTDFTLPTIDGFHNHILGGSWISLGNLGNVNSRYAFRRHFYQYAGIRYVASTNTYHDSVQKMFDEVKITRHITENYSEFKDDTLVEKKPVPNWPQLLGQRSADLINKEYEGKPLKVLVVYGGVGRVTLELLRNCQNLSIDHSDDTANKLQVLEQLMEKERIQWYQQVEGKICTALDYHFDSEKNETSDSLLKAKNNSVTYAQADYKNIRPQFDGYDVIVGDVRHKDGGSELEHVVKRLKTNGLLILGSIDNTSEGVQHNDKHSLAVLQSQFQRVVDMAVAEFPHMFQETRNKHQYGISYLSAWRKSVEPSQSVGGDFNVIPSSSDVSNTTDYYEDANILKSYDAFHFGDGLLSVKNFPLRMGEVIIEMCDKYKCNFGSALDAGCGPGRTAMELCARFSKVEGYDYSQGFIDMMNREKNVRKLDNLLAYQGDSHKQNEICHEKNFDMIFGCNLIDRLHSPELWVQQSKKMLNKGGLLIVSSPYTWKPEHTEPSKWLGGYQADGENKFTVDGLRAHLAPELVLLEELKVPFVIPDADGTFQYTYSNCTVFGSADKKQ